MDVVSFETAVKLKEAGFLPIDFYAGQFWYCRSGAYGKPTKHADLRLLGPAGSSTIIAYDHIGGIGRPLQIIPQYKKMKPIWEVYNSEDLYFAPNTTDILRQFDTIVSLRLHTDVWDCTYFKSGPAKDGNWFPHQGENAAEVVAAAWLDYQTRKSA